MSKAKIIINRQSASGDVLMTSPIVKKMYQDYDGDCEIDFWVMPQCSDMVKNNPYIHRIITRLPSESDYKNYDRGVNLDLVYERSPRIHAVDAYAMEAFGNTDFDRSLELFTTDQDRLLAREFRERVSNNYITLHMRRWPWPSRNMPEVFWKSVIEHILANSDVTIVQIGMPGEPSFTGNSRIINALGHFTVHEVKEIIAGSRCYLGSDSGPAHIASTTTTPMVVLYTSVKEEYRRPLRDPAKFIPIAADIDCYGCHADNPAPCTTFICRRGDIECVNRFDAVGVADQVLSNLQETQ